MLKRWCGGFAVWMVAVLAGAQTASPGWVGTWATSPVAAQGGFNVRVFAATTVREVVHISAGGGSVRVRFTNEFGLDPLTLSNVHVALSAGGGAIKDGTDHPLTFGGADSVRIAPGAAIYSDGVSLKVAPLSDVAISFYVPAQTMRAETFHSFADQENWMAQGDVSGSTTLPSATKLTSWFFISGVDVEAGEGSRAIVALGDSITDGALTSVNTNHRWPDVLAARLNHEQGMEHVSVLNEGIGGNRVLNEGFGPAALARLDRDVLGQTGAKYLVILEGINDIGRLQRLQAPEDEVTAQGLELGLKQIADAAHLHGLKVYGATLTPYGGAGSWSEKGEQIREEVNQWIRSSGTFDAVIDFDQITRDPQNPNRFNALYDSGDHLHPKDAGYKAMGEGIDLKLFK